MTKTDRRSIDRARLIARVLNCPAQDHTREQTNEGWKARAGGWWRLDDQERLLSSYEPLFASQKQPNAAAAARTTIGTKEEGRYRIANERSNSRTTSNATTARRYGQRQAYSVNRAAPLSTTRSVKIGDEHEERAGIVENKSMPATVMTGYCI